MEKKQNTVITIRINEDLYQAAQKIAEKRGATFSQFIRGLLIDELNKDTTEGGLLSKPASIKLTGPAVHINKEVVDSLFGNQEFRSQLKKFIDSDCI